MKQGFFVVIPARFDSARLPGKPLLDIGGCPLLRRVYQAAVKSNATDVIIATDDERIETAAKGFADKVVRTAKAHQSGTDRIAEAVTLLGLSDDCIIVNVQGDQLDLPPALINQVANNLAGKKAAAIASLYMPIQSTAELNNPNTVKVVADHQGYALFFSRSPIPWKEPEEPGAGQAAHGQYRHIGIYAYTCEFLKIYAGLPVCELERTERLEQLRALYHGFKIHVEQAKEKTGLEINAPEDLELANKLYGN